MKIFSIGLFLLLVFESLEGSTIPTKRSSRALNTSFITDFNGTYQRKDPCTNTEVESSTYKASHEFHHQSQDADWTNYTIKCSNIIKGFLQAITDLLASKCQQNSTFNFNINTTVSQNSDDCLLEGDNGTNCFSPKITIQTTNYEIPSSNCQNYRMVNCIGEYRGGSNEKEVKNIQIRGRKYKCFPVCDEEKSEEIEIPKPKVSEAPEQEQQTSSQSLAETLVVEPAPSNPEFQQIPLTQTTEITEVDEIISPKIDNEFVLPTTFTPFDTFQSQTETVTDTETVENIKELPVEVFTTTSTYYDEELKQSEKLVTKLPIKSFEISGSPPPVAQFPTKTSFEENTETVTAKTTEEISTGDQVIPEIPVTIPPQPTTFSAAYTEEIVQNVYNPTPEPASQITLSPLLEIQPQTSPPLADQTSELNVPLVASQPSQFETFETLNETEVTLPLADQITPENQYQTESVTEEVYEVETSTSQPPSPVIVEAPLLVPQTQPELELSEDQTLSESAGETFTVQEPVIQETHIVPEIQPDSVPLEISESPLDSATTEKLETEVYEEESASTPTFLPSAPETEITQVEENDYESFQKETFQEYSSTPLPFVEQSDFYQEKTIETASLPPEVESYPESTYLPIQATLPEQTYTEEVVSVENDETPFVTQPFPETTIPPSFPSEEPYIPTSSTSNESLKEDVYLLEPEQNVAVQPSTSSVSQTISESFEDFQTSPSPSYDISGQLSNKNFQEIQADSLVTEAPVYPQVEPDILVEASAVPAPEYVVPCDDESTSNDTLTTLSSNSEVTAEIYNENLSTPFPVQPQSPLVSDQSFESESQFVDSKQESQPNYFVPITEQPDIVTKNIEIIEKDIVEKEYTTPAPSVQPLELLITPQPQPSKSTFFEKEIVETKTPVFETTVAPTEIVSFTNLPEEEQRLSLSQSIDEQKTIEEEPSLVTSPIPEISSSVSDQAFYTPLVSEPEAGVVPEYPNQPTNFNEQVVATEYNDYSTLEPQVPENEYFYETQPPLELPKEIPTTQSSLAAELEQEKISTSQSEYITEVPEFFTQPPVNQAVVNSESQTLSIESQVPEIVEEQAVTPSLLPQSTTTSSVVEENFSNTSETEPLLSSPSEEFSSYNEYSDVFTTTPEQDLNTFYDLGSEFEEQKQKETVAVSEAEVEVPEEQSTPFVSYEPEYPAEQLEVSPVLPSLETQSQTENLTYFQDVVTEQYQPNDQQFEITTPYPQEQFEPVPTTQPEEPCEDEQTLSQSQAEAEATVNYSDTLSEQNTYQPQLDYPQNIFSTQPPQVQHKPFVDFDELTTPTPGMTVYEDQPFAIKYQTSIGPQTVTDTTTSFFEEDITNSYSSTSPQPLPVVYSQQKESVIGPKTQNVFEEKLISDQSEISKPLEQQEEFIPSTSETYTSAPFYDQETDYTYSETSSTSSAPELDYYSEPFVPTLSPEEESTTPFETLVTEQTETFDQKPETPAETLLSELEEKTQSVEKLTDNISYSDVLDEQAEIPVVSNTEKDIIESYDQDFTTTTTTSYNSESELADNSQTEVVEEIENLSYEPLTTTPSTEIFLTTELPPKSEDSFAKEFQSQTSTTVSQNTEEFETVPVQESPYLPYSETSADVEVTQTSATDEEQSFSTLPPQVQYPLTDLESSSLLSDQLSQTTFEESLSNSFSTPGISQEQPLETNPEQPCLDCEVEDTKIIKSVPEEPCLDGEKIEEVVYEASTFKPDVQTYEVEIPQQVQSETVQQFTTTTEQFSTTTPEVEVDIYLPSKATQKPLEAVESTTTAVSQESDTTTSYVEEEQQLYNVPSSLAPQSELSVDYAEQTEEVDYEASTFKPDVQTYEVEIPQQVQSETVQQFTTTTEQFGTTTPEVEIDIYLPSKTTQKPLEAVESTTTAASQKSDTTTSYLEEEQQVYNIPSTLAPQSELSIDYAEQTEEVDYEASTFKPDVQTYEVEIPQQVQSETVQQFTTTTEQFGTTTPEVEVDIYLPSKTTQKPLEVVESTTTAASQESDTTSYVEEEQQVYNIPSTLAPETQSELSIDYAEQTEEVDYEASTFKPNVQTYEVEIPQQVQSETIQQFTTTTEQFSTTTPEVEVDIYLPSKTTQKPLEAVESTTTAASQESDTTSYVEEEQQVYNSPSTLAAQSELSIDYAEQTEEVDYEASTFKPNVQTYEVEIPQQVQSETVEQFTTTTEQFGTTTPEVEIDIYLPSKTTQKSVEAVESTTTAAPQIPDTTTSYLEEEQQVYNFPSTLAPQSELSVDYVEQTPETSVSESSNPSIEIVEQYSDANNFSESTTSSFQEISSMETTQAPQEKPIPAYDETLLTVPSTSQTSFSNYEDENLSYDTLTQQTQLPESVTSVPLSETEEVSSSLDDSTQEFFTPFPETDEQPEEPCSDCEPSNPVVTNTQPEISGNSDYNYEYEEINTSPPPLYEQSIVPLLTEKVAEKNSETFETMPLEEFPQTTTAPFYDEAIENQSSFAQEEVFESQQGFKSTSFPVENTPYITVLPNTESQFTSSTTELESNEFSSTPLPSLYVPISEESKLSDSQTVNEEQCEGCEEKTYTEKPLDYIDQNLNSEYVTTETVETETTKDTSVVPESMIVPIPADEQELQPLTPKPEPSPTVIYDELPQIAETNSQESFYSYDDLSTTTTSDQQLPYYDSQPLAEQEYPGHFQQFNVKNTVSDSLVTEKVTNEQPSMIYDTTLSPESASESFQTVVQLNSTPQPQPTTFVNEPVYQPSLLPAQPQLSTEHLSTASETSTTQIPKSNVEPYDDAETDIVTTPPVVSDSQFTENLDYNEELSYFNSNDYMTEKPEFTPEILVTQTTPDIVSQSQSVVNDEVISTDTYFSPTATPAPTATVFPVELPSSQQTDNNFSTEKQFSEVYEEVGTEKPQPGFVPLPILYPVNSSQIPTKPAPLPESQTTFSTSTSQPQTETVLFYDSKTVTTNNNFSTPAPSQVLSEVPLVSPLPPIVIPQTNVPVIPQTNKFVELDEEIITVTKAPETRPESLATVNIVTSTLPPQPPKQVVEVDEEILTSNKNPQPVKTVTTTTANSAALPQNLPPNLLYFEEEIVTTKTPPSSIPQTSIPLEPLTVLPTAPQTLAFPSLSQKTVEVDQEVITSKYPPTVTASVTPQPQTTPVAFVDEKLASQTLYSTPLPGEAKKVEKEVVIENKPIVSQEQYITSSVATLPPLVTTPAPVPLPKKFTEVDEEIFVVNKQSTPNVNPLLLTTLAPTPLPQGIKEFDQEIIITKQPTTSQGQSSLPPFLQPIPSPLPPNKAVNEEIVLTNEQTASPTNSFDKNVTPAVTILPPQPQSKKFVEVDQEIVFTSKQPVSQTTIPSFIPPLIPLETTLAPRPVSNAFKEVDEEIIITSKPVESQPKTSTPSLIQAVSPVTTTVAPSSSTKKFTEVDEEIILSGKQPVPTLSPLFVAPVPTSLPLEPSAKKFMEVDEEVIITNKPTTPQLLATTSPVPPIVSSTTVQPTKKTVEFFTNDNPTSPSLLNYSDDLSQIQSAGIALPSSSLKPQTQPEKVTYFNQEVFTTTATPNTVPLQTDAYIPLQPIQPIAPQLQSQTVDYFEEQPQVETFEAKSPVVTSFPTVTNTPQEMYPNAGVSVAQVDTSSQQSVSYDLVPEQTTPSSKPGENSCSCCSGSSAPLLCPFNPALKGNMSAPSYYILVSKIPHPSGSGEQSFQVEKVFLGDGTPLNCTLTDKTFPTSLYKPIPIASSRPVTLQTTNDHS